MKFFIAIIMMFAVISCSKAPENKDGKSGETIVREKKVSIKKAPDMKAVATKDATKVEVKKPEMKKEAKKEVKKPASKKSAKK